MEQSARIGVGRRIARTLEHSREKRAEAEEGREAKRIERIPKSLKVGKGQRRLKLLEDGGTDLTTVEKCEEDG
jgi:hypothetical protein